MSLDWSVAKCKDWKQLLDDDHKEVELKDGTWYSATAITQHMVFATMATDIGKVTETNAAEFYARYCIARKITGDEILLTPAMIQRRIGLTTNVVTKSFTQFLKAWGDSQLRQYRRAYDKALATKQPLPATIDWSAEDKASEVGA